MPTDYEYNLVVLNLKEKKFIEMSLRADSFRKAFASFLKVYENLIHVPMRIYCMRPKSEDLKYMGYYSGDSGIGTGGEIFTHILNTAEGRSYRLSEEGFITYF